ncbi:MAG TPA: hypothetical protein VHK70_07730 [Burkholderiaceae bacterium]|nr:hypothetical protein [Burkholderiaceae bacterium]
MRRRTNKAAHGSTFRRLSSWGATLCGIVWALPLTLLGMLAALPIVILRGHIYVVFDPTPALLVRGAFADYLLARHPFGAMCAMAIGHVVIAEQHGLTRQVLTHELAHVRQAAHWGILFPFAYLAASAWAALHGQDAYWYNTFEIAARNAEQHG